MPKPEPRWTSRAGSPGFSGAFSGGRAGPPGPPGPGPKPGPRMPPAGGMAAYSLADSSRRNCQTLDRPKTSLPGASLAAFSFSLAGGGSAARATDAPSAPARARPVNAVTAAHARLLIRTPAVQREGSSRPRPHAPGARPPPAFIRSSYLTGRGRNETPPRGSAFFSAARREGIGRGG